MSQETWGNDGDKWWLYHEHVGLKQCIVMYSGQKLGDSGVNQQIYTNPITCGFYLWHKGGILGVYLEDLQPTL